MRPERPPAPDRTTPLPPDPGWRALAGVFGGLPPAGHPAGALPPRLARRFESVDPERLEVEYVRLFVNALPEVPCPPYASVYLEGSLLGAAAGRVRALYRRYGVESDGTPDHFAVEAAFLAALLPVARRDDAAARDLAWLADHLRGWAPAFFRSVEAHDRTGVYAEAARWGRTLLDELEPVAP